MKTLLRICLCFLVISPITLLAQNSSAQSERIQSSYLLAFGRAPNSGELNYWLGQGQRSIADLIALHRNYLSRDAGNHRAAITRAYVDAMGRNPSTGEINYWMQGTDTYAQLMKNHMQWLAGNPAEYANVIRRSYQFVLGRQPNAGELAYWQSQGVLSYVVLVGCHEQWRQQNGSRAQTSGQPMVAARSSFLVTVPVSPAIANEARMAAGIVAAGGGNIVAAGGGNIVAAGGGNIVAAGGGNIVAAGGGN